MKEPDVIIPANLIDDIVKECAGSDASARNLRAALANVSAERKL